jgi:large subunit ribosomal protein L9
MKVLLLKDVYKLGHAGDVKKVADGYGRNYLLPRGLAALATKGAIAKAETLRTAAAKRREELNTELGGLAEKLSGLTLRFSAKAGETGKLYGSITTQMIAEAIEKESGEKIDRRDIGHQPLRELGTFKVPVRLTADLAPNVTVVIGREGEAAPAPLAAPVAEASAAEESVETTAEAAVEEVVEEATAE